MSSNPLVANKAILPIDDTAANPSISIGGSGNLVSNSSGTGIYGTISSVKVSILGSDLATFNASGLTLSSGAFVGSVTGGISGGAVAATNLSASGTLTLNTGNFIVVLNAAGAPTNGTTGANVAGPGSLYIDITAGKLYINTNTKASPTWTVVGTQS